MAFRIQPLARPASRATAFAAGCTSSSSSTSTAATCRPLLSLFQQQPQQVRYARTMTKAEEEDLQGIPVRLLRDIVGFGRKHAIIRVKPGRMRNVWHHKGLAEYMTKLRFAELGVTEAAIGVRDRTFGTQMLVDEDSKDAAKSSSSGAGSNQNKKNNAMLEGGRTQSVRRTFYASVIVLCILKNRIANLETPNSPRKPAPSSTKSSPKSSPLPANPSRRPSPRNPWSRAPRPWPPTP